MLFSASVPCPLLLTASLWFCVSVYPVKEFQGEKRIYLSTMSWAGGKNPFLGTVSIGYGIVCFVLVLGVQLMAFIYPR